MPVQSILTANQQAVFQALGETRSPLSAYAILERLKSKGIKAPLQVYRALEKLIEFGLVHRLESINAFVICDHHGDHAQHPVAFAICDACGLVSEFADPSLQEGLTRWTTGHAFRPKRVTVEIRGLCETCDGASE